jgi:hypothetical protein
MEEFYYITENFPNKKIRLYPSDELNLYSMNIIELVIPPCKYINCNNNKLTKLIIPIGCRSVCCYSNQLTELIIPKDCKFVSCWNNKLIKLIIHEGCKEVWCYDNNLTELILPKSCEFISCSGNKLHLVIEKLFDSDNPIKIELANNLQIANNIQKNINI